MKDKEKLLELVGLIYEIDHKDKDHDWFFNYSGHVKTVMIYFSSHLSKCKCCGSDTRDSTYLTFGVDIYDLDSIIATVRERFEKLD